MAATLKGFLLIVSALFPIVDPQAACRTPSIAVPVESDTCVGNNG